MRKTGPIGLFSLCLAAAIAAVLMVACDWRFSLWLARTRGWWFAVGTVPLRLMYYALNVLSVGIGLCQAWAHRRLPAAIPAASARPRPVLSLGRDQGEPST